MRVVALANAAIVLAQRRVVSPGNVCGCIAAAVSVTRGRGSQRDGGAPKLRADAGSRGDTCRRFSLWDAEKAPH